MSNEQIHEIKEALSLLSAERVNTSGLGAPINILKRLIEDSEEATSANNAQVEPTNGTNPFPSVEKYLIRHLLDRCKENQTTIISDEEITEILDDPEMIAFVKMMGSYAELRAGQAKEEIKRNVMITIKECLREGHIDDDGYQVLKAYLTVIFN